MITVLSGGASSPSVGAQNFVSGFGSAGAVAFPVTARGWIKTNQINTISKTGPGPKLMVQGISAIPVGHLAMADSLGDFVDGGVPGGGGGSGTVTSVDLTMPAEFSVSGNPITTSGTLAVTKATQSANLVFAGPTTGSAAAPTFRGVVAADLPLGSSSAFGAVKVDNVSITASSGVISGVWAKLGEQILGSAAATVTFSSIPGTYRALKLFLRTRSSNANVSIYMQFNGDTAANYSRSFVVGTSGPTNSSGFAQSSGFVIAQTALSTAPANCSSSSEVTINDYARTAWQKSAFGLTERRDSTSAYFIEQWGMSWRNTAAITSITFGIASGGNFTTDSVFSLYGIT